MNKAILIGRLGSDIELKYVASGEAVANTSLATSKKYKDKAGEKHEKTTWHKIVIWGKLAETANQYLKKGSQVCFEGEIDNRSYDNKEGKKMNVSEVIVKNMKMLGGGEDKSQNSTMPEEPPPYNAPEDDSDLPF